MNKLNILLITESKAMEEKIKNQISSLKYEVHKGEIDNLMMDVYTVDAKIMIVDLDYSDVALIEMIDSIRSIEYLPVIYIYSNPFGEEILELTNEDVTLHKSIMEYALPMVIKNSTGLKNQYDHVMESYNTVDEINRRTDEVLKKYINTEFDVYKTSIKDLLEYSYTKNIFLKNKPEYIFVISHNPEGKIVDFYSLKNRNLEYDKNYIKLSEKEEFTFDIYAETGFLKNVSEKEYSDIDNSSAQFPEKMMDRLNDKVKNFAGMTIEDTTIIGINYNNNTSKFDIDIVGTLCVNYALIKSTCNQMNKVNEAFEYTIDALVRAAEASDDKTGKHIKRVNEYSKLIAEELGMDKNFVKEIYFAAQMHDVGKIYVPKEILSKPGKLTDEEYEIMKKHTIYGEKIIGDSEYLSMSAEIALNHHERYDGTGYPNRKKGEEIPLSARIVMMADIYDALRSPRYYKPPFSHEKAYEIIVEGDGRVEPKHFDPKVYQIFKSKHTKFEEIYKKFS